MEKQQLPEYELIETEAALEAFYEKNKDVEWFCFDTEFIGEKRYRTLLCLIQVATEHGYYLIDSIKITNLSTFLQIIEDEKVLKITHAGENDYRLLYNLYGTIPKNTFDAQIGGGFIGYKYPVSFSKLVEGELNVRLAKGFAVTDWQARPFSPRQIKYALNDVIYLYDLWQLISQKAEDMNRLAWIYDECKLMENADYYYQDPNKDALNSNMMRSVRFKEQVFLLRIFGWRRSEAERKDYSKEMVLSQKLIGPITRAMGAGSHALSENRRIPDHISRRYSTLFFEMYEAPPTEEEQKVLKSIPQYNEEDPDKDIITEMLHLIIKNQCLQDNLSANIVMPRSIIKNMKQDESFFEPILETTWRREFLSDTMINWLKNRKDLKMSFKDGDFRIELEQS